MGRGDRQGARPAGLLAVPRHPQVATGEQGKRQEEL